MPPSTTQLSELFTTVHMGLQHVTKAVEALQRDQGRLLEVGQETASKLAVLESSVGALKEEFDRLVSHVRDGNGQPSLTHRVTTMEAQVTQIRDHGQTFVIAKFSTMEQQLLGLRQDLNRALDQLEEAKKAMDSVESARVLSRGQVIAGIISALVAAGMSLWSVLAQLMSAPKPSP